MATQLQIRRGTAAQVAAFTGAEGEIVYNSTNDSLHTNDGATAGGFELARADLNNVLDADLNAALTGNTLSALTITTLTSGAATFSGLVAVSPASGTAAITFTSTGVGSEVFSINGQIPGVSNTGFAIRNVTDSRNDLTIDGTGAATFSGTVTADGLTVDGGGSLTFSELTSKITGPLNQDFIIQQRGNADTEALRIQNLDNNNLAKFDKNGDISFYEDTGTTPKFFWDASAESLGIGTSSPSRALATKSSSVTVANFESTSATAGFISFSDSNTTNDVTVRAGAVGDNLVLQAGGTERMRIDGASGNVGIGTGAVGLSTNGLKTVIHGATGYPATSGTTQTGVLRLSGGAGLYNVLDMGVNESADSAWIQATRANSLGTYDKLLLNPYGGNVGIGTSTITNPYSQTPFTDVNIDGTWGGAISFKMSGVTKGWVGQRSSGNEDMVIGATAGQELLFYENNVEAMRISSGNLLVGTTSYANLDGLNHAVVIGGGAPALILSTDAGLSASMYGTGNASGSLVWYDHIANAVMMSLTTAGALSVVGALSKGSGSFKINHPLPAMTDTHHLVHSFVEAPDAVNLYAGMVDLVDGVATVNIDLAHRMTQGTFEVLNHLQSWSSSNESGYAAVKCSMAGNILTIECQDPTSTDSVYYEVRGVRKDQHMLDTEWTDENGKVIVEPLKELEGA